MLLAGLGFLVAGYLALCALLYLRQRDLLYLPAYTRVDAATTDFALQRPDAVLRGWVVNPGQPRALLYFGGNGEAVQHNRDDFARWFPGWTTYLVAYRGYGASDGSPRQSALFADALALHDDVRTRHADIAAIGRSLGSGVAIHVAAQRPLDRLALITPFDSIARVAQSAYPWVPAQWLIEDRYDSIQYAAKVEIPVLVLVAVDDEIIPTLRTDGLIAGLPTAPQVVRIPAAGHNTIQEFPAFASALREFFHPDR